PAGATPSASHIERHRNQVANVKVLDVFSFFDDLAGYFVTEHQSFWRSGAATNHMLIGAADVGRHHFQNHRVLDLLACGILKLWVVDRLHLDLVWSEVYNTVIVRH